MRGAPTMRRQQRSEDRVNRSRATITALAASVVLVAVTGTLAAAAVFQLPILGFGTARAATPVERVELAATPPARRVMPRRVVKVRVVTDVVHRPAPVDTARN